MSKKKQADPVPKQAAEKVMDELDQDNTVAGEAKTSSGSVVYVFANLQNGQRFRLPNGDEVRLEGFPVSGLKDSRGNAFAGGKYGVTEVSRDAWVEVTRIYGKMQMFQSGLVFAADSLENGKAMARERGGLRHGYEPVDPAGERAKSNPKSED